MKYQLNISPLAWSDINGISEYISNDLKNSQVVKNILEGLLESISNLKNFPESNPRLFVAGNIDSGYRYSLYKNYMCFYRICEKKIFVDRVLYAKSNYLSILFKEKLDK